MNTKNLACFALLLALAVVVGGMGSAAPRTFRQVSVTLHTENGKHILNVELAEKPDQHAYGLKQREQLAADSGMLFDFGAPRLVAMWMEDTKIPLDMIFLDARGTVVHIEQNTTPFSRDKLMATVPIRGVLELNAGKAKEWKVQHGDRVEYEGWK